jgi:hypothetical protein
MGHVLCADGYRGGHANGLFFIAFSVRMQDLQLSLLIRTRARYLLLWLIVITLVSAFVLMPGQSNAALATEILVLSAGSAAYTAWSAVRTLRQEPPPFSADLLGRWLGMGATWLLSIGAGISLLAGHGGGLYLLAFAVLLGIALEVAAAWSLIVGIGRDIMPGRRHTPGRTVKSSRSENGHESGSGGSSAASVSTPERP